MPSESSAKEARRNQRIGRYEVLQYLATGGMGAVYKALDTASGKEVALKVLPPDIAVKPGMLERFQQEAVHASKLRHEHIVTLYEYGEANHVHFLAMELIDGIDLHEYVSRKGPLGPDEARVIVAQAAQALDHAHEQGIVHRDIKPSNFLITRNVGRLWVKLTDFGLAREAADDEFRVTRAGSTVGTVDYMAPEQARDSRAADRRSDIYSLGCTLYFMLSGRPPFPEGGLTERILQHAEAEPPDICTLNPLVPHTLAAVLQRMLAKKPANRYQTAAALLEDLERLRSGDGPRHMEVFTMLEELEESSVRRRRSFTMAIAERGDAGPRVEEDRLGPRKPDSSARRRMRKDDTEDEVPAKTQAVPKLLAQGRSRQALYVAVPLMVLLAMLSGVLTWWLLPRKPADNGPGAPPVEVGHGDPNPEPRPEVRPEPQPVVKPEPPKLDDKPPPVKPNPPRVEVKPTPPKPDPPPVDNRVPRLYESPRPVQADALREGFLKPWAQTPPPQNTPVLRVSRAGGEGRFTSLAAAVAAAPADQETVIEIHDNGPLFEPALEVQNRSLILRAAKGYRPLIAWKRGGAGRAQTFLRVSGGNLTLENVDLVHQADESEQADEAVLCRVAGGDFLAQGCTFSVAGRPRGKVSLIRMEGAPARPARVRCRLTACYLRGADVEALDLQTPGAEVLLEDALLVGGSRPLLTAAGKATDAPTVLRVLRSTLVAGQTILRIRPHAPADSQPQVHWQGWDALLARSSGELGGEMVVLADNAGAGGVQWQATNCLYAGWQTLLGGREHIGAGSLGVWQTRWGRSEGDRAVPETWPARTSSTPGEDSPEAYRTQGTHVWYRGTAGGEVLGCNLRALPPVREAWASLTYGRVVAPAFPMPHELAPEIPSLADGAYHGEKLNANETDLGEHLARVQERMRLGPRVVLHVSGTGERHTSPIRVRGTTLVIWFAPPLDENDPLSLTFAKGQGHPPGLVDVEDGNLELIGVSLKLENSNLRPHPRHLVRVRGGELRVFGSRLTGPLHRAPKTFEGLIGFEGSGDSSAAQARSCGIADSVLVAGNTCIHLLGTGARVHVKNSVLVAARDALHLDPGPMSKPRLNSQCFLESCTVAARRSVVRLSDAKDLIPLEPFLVQARVNVFLDPFAGASEAAMVAFDDDALARGLLQWQGDDNGYDKRLSSYLAPAVRTGERPRQTHATWSHLWGASGERDAVFVEPRQRLFDGEHLPLGSLALPATARSRRNEPLGADLFQLRLVKRPEKPKSPPGP